MRIRSPAWPLVSTICADSMLAESLSTMVTAGFAIDTAVPSSVKVPLQSRPGVASV
ncbi:hypothetical protein [Variovorax sp. UC122_21]|uniref:hypothetical protein n=1 Tax=Variovorax sp. UC122_21 TaxID=3374554 RepID=UPI00375820A6